MTKSDEPVYVSRIAELLALKGEMEGREIPASALADFVGVTRQAVSLWMSPKGINRLPDAPTQRKLERFFNVPWDRIWRLEESTEDSEPGQMEALVAI
jgi:transcriptional regulator with XRE-family HTH domain